MRTQTIRLFAVAALAIAASGCGFRQGMRQPLMRSPILVEVSEFHPVQIAVDIDEAGSTVGATAMFGPGLDIDRLAKALDARYARWRMPTVKYTWRVENQRFAVNLVQEGDWVALLYLPFVDTVRPPNYVTGPCSCGAAPAKSN